MTLLLLTRMHDNGDALILPCCCPQTNVEAFVFILGVASTAYVGFGCSWWVSMRSSVDKKSSSAFQVARQRFRQSQPHHNVMPCAPRAVLQIEVTTRRMLATVKPETMQEFLAGTLHGLAAAQVNKLLEACSRWPSRVAPCLLCSTACSSSWGATQEVEEVFADALESHHCTATLHLFTAKYVFTYRQNKHIERLHLGSAEVKLVHYHIASSCCRLGHLGTRACFCWGMAAVGSSFVTPHNEPVAALVAVGCCFTALHCVYSAMFLASALYEVVLSSLLVLRTCCLRAPQKKSPWFDVEFFVHERRQQIRSSDANTGATSIQSRVSLEVEQKAAERHSIQTREKQVESLRFAVLTDYV